MALIFFEEVEQALIARVQAKMAAVVFFLLFPFQVWLVWLSVCCSGRRQGAMASLPFRAVAALAPVG